MPCPHLLKGLLVFVLVAESQGHDLSSFLLELREQFRRHAFPVDHHSLHLQVVYCLLELPEHARQSQRQMIITPMGDGKQGMAFGIV